MQRSTLRAITQLSDIPDFYQNTPIGRLLEYQNLGRTFDTYTKAELFVGMCMDNRKALKVPDNFAFIIRAGGANLRYSEFKISYAISVGGIRHIALIGHNNCGMVNLVERKEQFIAGLVEGAGWSQDRADAHFEQFAPQFEIGNEIDFIQSEVYRLRKQYPKILVAPLMYLVESNRLFWIEE